MHSFFTCGILPSIHSFHANNHSFLCYTYSFLFLCDAPIILSLHTIEIASFVTPILSVFGLYWKRHFRYESTVLTIPSSKSKGRVPTTSAQDEVIPLHALLKGLKYSDKAAPVGIVGPGSQSSVGRKH